MTENDLQHSVLVHHELKEVTDRLLAEGIDYRAIAAGIASLAYELIGGRTGRKTVAAWFHAMGVNALTAQEINNKPTH